MNKLILLIFLTLFSSNVLATTIAQTTASTLNVRASPGGAVIFSLPKYSTVGVIQVQGNWAMIVYFPGSDPNKAKYGWVSISYLSVISSNSSSGSSTTNSYAVSGDDCEYEYTSNSQVCITAKNADLDCRESYDGSYYRDCEVDITYDVTTNYDGNGYLDTDIECEVEIEYKTKSGYSWKHDSNTRYESLTLYSYSSESGYMSFDFSFRSYHEVTNVKVDSVECSIQSIFNW